MVVLNISDNFEVGGFRVRSEVCHGYGAKATACDEFVLCEPFPTDKKMLDRFQDVVLERIICDQGEWMVCD